MTRKKSWLPTRKWCAAVVTALATWGTAFVNGGSRWTEAIIIFLIGIVSQAIITYLVPNEGTPGGVPVTVRKRKK
jgi:cytosine/uracil/thiamine/allantoin permease